MTSQDYTGLFTDINGTTDEGGGQARQSPRQFAGDSIDGSAAQEFTSGSSRVATSVGSFESPLDPTKYPLTITVQNLTFLCRCDACAVEYSFKHCPRPTASVADLDREQQLRDQRRKVIRPRRRNWPLFSAFEVAWAPDEWQRIQRLAGAEVDLECRGIWAMIYELRESEHMQLLPTPAQYRARKLAAK